MSWFMRKFHLLLSQVISVPFFKRPFQELDKPEKYGMKNTINLFIPMSTTNEYLGAWFCSPSSYNPDNSSEIEESSQVLAYANVASHLVCKPVIETVCDRNVERGNNEEVASLVDDQLPEYSTLILYLHGNAETRSQYHRRELYQIYQDMGYYVLAVDYRGYGDSSYAAPNEETLVEDATEAVKYAISKWKRPGVRFIIHGHSLGTAVTVKALHNIVNEENHEFDCVCDGVILEAPFNCMLDEVNTFKAAKALSYALDIDQALREAKCEFNTAKWISSVQAPILLIHAQDDKIVPHELGERLFNTASESGCSIQMRTFDADEKLGHENICFALEYREIIANFVRSLHDKEKTLCF